MNVSSFFQGSVLKFSVTGEGVAIDPETGELSVATPALAGGLTLTVTALDAVGAAGRPFTLTIAAAPADLAPSLLTPPALAGSGRIGAALTVVPGAWGGEPAPAIALQWLRGGAAIAGATGDAYVPQAADDGQAITCRVTASNASGELATEPAPVVATRTPPAAVAALADVTVDEGAAAVAVDAAAAFAGEGLRFAVTGTAATVDPATGRVTIATAAPVAGATVTVTAANSGGAAAVSFRLTVAAKPTPIPPLLLAAPLLAGTGKVGSTLSVDAGGWGGLPAPLLSRQWLRDGAAIAGATGATYVPVDADDRCALACRVTAANSAGSLSAATAALAVTQVAPALAGELFDEVFDQDSGLETVATAQVFTGRRLGYAVAGGGATIDAATGVLTIPTDRALSGETVTVTATNSGGAAEASFLLTIEGADAFPLPLADTAWSAVEVRDAAPAGRRRVAIDGAAVVPEGFELRLYSGPLAGGARDLTNRVMTPGETFTTSGSVAVGATCYTLLLWRRIADGAWASASREVVFPIAGLDTPPGSGGAGYDLLPAANVVSAASWSAVDALIAARIASGAAGTYIIDLPNGAYGGVSVAGRAAADNQTIVVRSQTKSVGGTHVGGAKFTSIHFGDARGIFFQFVDVDRAGLGSLSRPVDMRTATRCGLEYSRIRVAAKPSGGWARGSSGEISGKFALYSLDMSSSTDCVCRANLFFGLGEDHVYGAGWTRALIELNVFQDVSTDCIKISWGTGLVCRDNWLARDFNAGIGTRGWDHVDAIQTDGLISGGLINYTLAGNVVMLRSYNGTTQANPVQGVFGSSATAANMLIEQNIVCTNSMNGIQIGGTAANNSGHVIRRNTVLRSIDYLDATTTGAGSPGCFVSAAPSVIAAQCVNNVEQRSGGGAAFGVNGLRIGGSFNSWAASEAYYTSARRASTFYELRPVAGQPTHWDYSGTGGALGAAEKFRRAIVGKEGFPKLGPAWAAWKQDFDWKNQIIGAA